MNSSKHQKNRRVFLNASANVLAGLPLVAYADPVFANATARAAVGGQAKSVILFFLCGGASHIDTWDMKPDAPVEYRGPFGSIATSTISRGK